MTAPHETAKVECPVCGSTWLPVTHVRPGQGWTIRYRRCGICGRRMTTYEVHGRFVKWDDLRPGPNP